ncbi:MAG: hypothetical protein WCQ41_10260 [Bacillota bacterium]
MKATSTSGIRKPELIMYPPGFGSYGDPSGEVVYFYCHNMWQSNMRLDVAKALLDKLYAEFNFAEDACSRTRAIAHLLTPFCQSLMGWRKKAPLWMFTAERHRSGKDYLAMISLIINEGVAVQDPPVEEDMELKRRITSAILAGRRFQHMANCRSNRDEESNKTDLDSPALEAAITSEFWSDRIIGTSDAPVMTNEIIFSLSFNGMLSITPDLTFRSRRVHLRPPSFKTNKHAFKTANLHSHLYSWNPRKPQSRTSPPVFFDAGEAPICSPRSILDPNIHGIINAWFENSNPFDVPYEVVVIPTNADMLNGLRFEGVAPQKSQIDISQMLAFKSTGPAPQFDITISSFGRPNLVYVVSAAAAQVPTTSGDPEFLESAIRFETIPTVGSLGSINAWFENPNPFNVSYTVAVTAFDATLLAGSTISGTAPANDVVNLTPFLSFTPTAPNPTFVIEVYRKRIGFPDFVYGISLPLKKFRECTRSVESVTKPRVKQTIIASFENVNLFDVRYEVLVTPTRATMINGVHFHGIAPANSIVDISSLLAFESTGANPLFNIEIKRLGESDPDITYQLASPPPLCRRNVLAALLALVQNWISSRKPEKIFTSFPEWASTVGGIMFAAGLGDPTSETAADFSVGGIRDEWMTLGAWCSINKISGAASGDIFDAIFKYESVPRPGGPLFSRILDKGKASFGRSLAKWANRANYLPRQIRVERDDSDITRLKYAFSFREEHFLHTYVDFVGIFRVPAALLVVLKSSIP